MKPNFEGKEKVNEKIQYNCTIQFKFIDIGDHLD